MAAWTHPKFIQRLSDTAGSALKSDITFLKPFLALPEDDIEFVSPFSEGSNLQGELRSVFAQMGRSQQAGSESAPKGKQKELCKTQSYDSKKLWWKGTSDLPHPPPGIQRWKINELTLGIASLSCRNLLEFQ